MPYRSGNNIPSVFANVALGMLGTVSLVALPVMAGAQGFRVANGQGMHMAKEYTVNLQPLNKSGASGTALVVLQDKTLTVKFDVMGLQPDKVHDAHIHGMLNGVKATCPTMAFDTNGDGYLSVFEGAPAYGVIKVSLSAPITLPGANPNATLFAPFAGVDSNAFQSADSQGMDHFDQSITYNLSDPEATAAYKGIMPLRAQAIVIHGAMAPESVDTMNGSTTKIVYDELLPVACGDLKEALKGQATDVPMMPTTYSSTNMSGMDMPMVAGTNQSMMSGMDMPTMQTGAMVSQNGNVDQQVSQMYEARNSMIDMLNRVGDVLARDKFLSAADQMIQRFVDMTHMNR